MIDYLIPTVPEYMASRSRLCLPKIMVLKQLHLSCKNQNYHNPCNNHKNNLCAMLPLVCQEKADTPLNTSHISKEHDPQAT